MGAMGSDGKALSPDSPAELGVPLEGNESEPYGVGAARRERSPTSIHGSGIQTVAISRALRGGPVDRLIAHPVRCVFRPL